MSNLDFLLFSFFFALLVRVAAFCAVFTVITILIKIKIKTRRYNHYSLDSRSLPVSQLIQKACYTYNAIRSVVCLFLLGPILIFIQDTSTINLANHNNCPCLFFMFFEPTLNTCMRLLILQININVCGITFFNIWSASNHLTQVSRKNQPQITILSGKKWYHLQAQGRVLVHSYYFAINEYN